jgi:hypothetical protein
MARRKHYHVYVIELSKDVLFEGRFKRCNPNYTSGKPCVYVGMTGIDPVQSLCQGIWTAPAARSLRSL